MKTIVRLVLCAMTFLGSSAFAQLGNPAATPPEDMAYLNPGSNDYEVQRDFAANIYASFNNSVQRVFNLRRLSAAELTQIRLLYQQATGSSAPLDALVRLGPTNYQSKYFADPSSASVIIPSIMLTPRIHAIPPHLLDMTIYEIYLEYRTMPFGSLSPAGAMYETAAVVTEGVGQAFAAGFAIGTMISYLIELYDPDLDNAIGGTIANMLEQVQNAGTDASTGQYRDALRALFGVYRQGQPHQQYASGGVIDSSGGFINGIGGPVGTVTVSAGFFPDDLSYWGTHK